MRISKSHQDDDMPTKIWKSIADLVVYLLSKIITLSIASGIFPDRLKISKIIPIHKKGSKDLVVNYRPISILPIMSKIFEKYMLVRINGFLEKFKLLAPSQYGFRKSHSTRDAIIFDD